MESAGSDVQPLKSGGEGVLTWAFRSARGWLGRSPILHQASQMLASRGISLVLTAAGTIWASRCLGPEKLGISGFIVTFVTVVALLTDMNQDIGLVRAYKAAREGDEKVRLALGIFSLRWMLAGVWCILAIALLWLAGLPTREWVLGATAAFPLLLFTVNQSTWVLQSQGNMPARYRALLVQTGVAATGYLLFFRPGKVPAGADVVVMACAMAAEFALGWWFALRPLAADLRTWLRTEGVSLARWWGTVREALRHYSAGRYLAVSGALWYIYVWVQIPLVGVLLGTAALGEYRTAFMLVNGFQAFAAIVPALLYPRMIDWSQAGPQVLWQKQLQLFRMGALILVPAALAGFVFAKPVYRLLFGPEFAAAAYPFALLLAGKMVMVLQSFFSSGLFAQGRDRLMLGFTAATAGVSLLLNISLIPRLGLLGAAGVSFTCELLLLVATYLASRPRPEVAPPNQ